MRSTLLDRLTSGAISLKGKVGEVEPPYLILPLKTSFQTILDDKSGYDHLLLSVESRTFFGIRWGGWHFVYNTLPFGWKISPFVYHSTGLVVSNFFRSVEIPCSLYIDDRHNGQLEIPLNQAAYANLANLDEHNLTAAKSAIFLVAYFLISLGYFLGLSKSILMPRKIVPYLGFLCDSSREVFHLIPEKKEKFLDLIEQTLTCSTVLRQMCVVFTSGPGSSTVYYGALREEISHSLFLRAWDDPLPWRDERHIRISLATDALASGWGGSVSLGDRTVETADYWTKEEQELDISVKEALALHKILLSFSDYLKNAWVDGLVDNQAVLYS